MGAQAPGPNEQKAIILTALSGYNRPFILIAVFIVSFGISYFLTKKNLSISLIVGLFATIATAIFFISTYSSQLRF